ncbi:M9 family metallopeptidase [Tahibacter amnicola]|uniref:microbial collagenase n=1 Tax=Tahibacter amnicola TaxID=2976241 RepID=A0ABY6BKM7_9GAMM|nr:M9 family metallopeptidase [Tahibacter amnicola]UXI70566.1 M9 family metallopeptidase [Tahibacter amnicola]
MSLLRLLPLHLSTAILAAAISGSASATPRVTWIPPVGAEITVSHLGTHRPGAERPPMNDPRKTDIDYDLADPVIVLSRSPEADARAGRAPQACNAADFANASDAALLTLVKAADVEDCLNGLFKVTGAQAGQIFGEAKMRTVANELINSAWFYPGDNSQKTLQLILFLRAGYYVQDNQTAYVGTYGSSLASSVRHALDLFVNNTHFLDVTEVHGDVLSEFVTLIDSAQESARHIGSFRRLLNNYGAAHREIESMQTATNNVFRALFRAHQFSDFRAAMAADTSLLTALSSFVSNNAIDIDTGLEYLVVNASRELTRFVNGQNYSGTTQSTARQFVKAILARYPMTGYGGRLWAATAGNAEFYDASNCAYYNICNFRTTLEPLVLPTRHPCSATLVLRAQNLTPQQIQQTCSSVGTEEGFFHQKMATGNVPIAGDQNSKLEMLVFDSKADYAAYAEVLFDIAVDNGGIYIEGDPTRPGNQARFYAYERGTPGTSSWQIWNLAHEYIHYLDGRFNMKGGFCDAPTGGACDYGNTQVGPRTSAVWYIEGIAEYLSYSFRNLTNTDAMDQAISRQFSLSELFTTQYSTDFARTYQWGYLASRFMYEHRRQQFDQMIQHFRAGRYEPEYRNWLTAIGTSYNADFRGWVSCFVSSMGNPVNCVPDRIFKGGFEPPPPLPECDDDDERVLANGCRRSNLSATTNSRSFFIWVPSGVPKLTIRMAGGTGNADMYIKAGGWPDQTTYDYRPFLPGNDETVTVNNPASGVYWYIWVLPRAPYTGMEISARFN